MRTKPNATSKLWQSSVGLKMKRPVPKLGILKLGSATDVLSDLLRKWQKISNFSLTPSMFRPFYHRQSSGPISWRRDTREFLKVLVEINRDRILGFTAFAVEGGEIMSSVQVAIITGFPYTAFRDAVLTHPTLEEGLGALFSSEPTMRNQRVLKKLRASPGTTRSRSVRENTRSCPRPAKESSPSAPPIPYPPGHRGLPSREAALRRA